MSFRDYVRQRRITSDPVGDFVIIARLDSGMPDAKTWDELRDYLGRQSAAPGVVECARRVWRGYLMARLRATEPVRQAST